MSNITALQFSKLESLSVTNELNKKLYKLHSNEKHPVMGSLAARTIGFIATPLTSLIDATVHSVFFVGKTASLVFIVPYNFVAKRIDTKYMAPEELQFSSALVHLARVAESLFNVILMPLLVLNSPNKAFSLSQNQAGGKEVELHYRDKIELIRKNATNRIDELNEKLKNNQEEIKKLESTIQKLRNEKSPALTGAENKIVNLEKEIEKLSKEVSTISEEKKAVEEKLSVHQHASPIANLQIRTLRKEKTTLENEKADLMNQIEQLLNGKNDGEENWRKEQEKNKKLEIQLKSVDEKISQTEMALKEALRKADLAEQKNKEISEEAIADQNRLANLNTSLKEKGTRLENLLKESLEAQNLLRKEVSQLTLKADEMKKLQLENERLEEELSETTEQLESIQQYQFLEELQTARIFAPGELGLNDKETGDSSVPFINTNNVESEIQELPPYPETLELDSIMSSNVFPDELPIFAEDQVNEKFEELKRSLNTKKLSLLDEIRAGNFKLASNSNQQSNGIKPSHESFLKKHIEKHQSNPIAIKMVYDMIAKFLDNLEDAQFNLENQDGENERTIALDSSMNLNDQTGSLFQSTINSLQNVKSEGEKKQLIIDKIEYFEKLLARVAELRKEYNSNVDKERQEELNRAYNERVEKENAQKLAKERDDLLSGIEVDFDAIRSNVEGTKWNLYIKNTEFKTPEEFKTNYDKVLEWCTTGNITSPDMKELYEKVKSVLFSKENNTNLKVTIATANVQETSVTYNNDGIYDILNQDDGSFSSTEGGEI